MTFDEAVAALAEAAAALPRPEQRYSPQGKRYRALQNERMLLSSPPAWPLLTPDQRQAIIDGGFKTGRYPQPGEGDPRPLVAARRAVLWAGLLSGEAWASRAGQLIPPRMLRRPTAGLQPEELMERLRSGVIWAWCCEGWVISRFDITGPPTEAGAVRK